MTHIHIADIRQAGKQGLQEVRESIADTLSDPIPMTSAEDFVFSSAIVHLGTAVAYHTQLSPLRLERTLRHVARGGLDHYQVMVPVAGHCRYEYRGGAIDMAPGSVGICDMSEAGRFDFGPQEWDDSSRMITLYFPRPLLAPLLANPDAVEAHTISNETAYGRLLHGHITALWREASLLSLAEREAAASSVALLVASGLRPNASAEDSAANARRDARLAAIKRYVRAHLSEELDAAALAARFGISRSVLYRLFEEDGGVARYVQRSRLERAFATLASPAQQHLSILEVALDCAFESDSSFIRTFRKHFGLTPGELRRLMAPRQGQLAADGATEEGPLSNFRTWLHTLSSAPTRR